MKTTAIKLMKAMVVLGLTFSAITSKANNGNYGASVTETEKTIKEAIKFPAACHANNQKVEILFTTNENGNVNFVLAKTDNKLLKQEIENQFLHMHFSKLNSNVVNSVTLNFKTL